MQVVHRQEGASGEVLGSGEDSNHRTRVVRVDFTEKVPLEQRPEGGQVGAMWIPGKSFPAAGTTRAKARGSVPRMSVRKPGS